MKRRLAVLDLYERHENLGLDSILSLVKQSNFEVQRFEVRSEHQFPKVRDFDAFISSGGPGDPHEVLTHPWAPQYRSFLDDLLDSNKPGFLICHSFQMACLHWNLADVIKRHRSAFGIYPVNKTVSGEAEPLLKGLEDPFWVVDSREWQVVQPHCRNAQVLAVERERPHVPLERATMMMRFGPRLVGTQFHPEGNEDSMRFYLDNPNRLEKMLSSVGAEKVTKIRSHLGDPNKIDHTHRLLLPQFLELAHELSKAG